MGDPKHHNQLKPWYIGVSVIVFSNLIFLYYIMNHECRIPNFFIVGLLVLLPAIYLTLMYAAFRSQQ